MLATNFAVIGARDLFFLSIRAYGKQGMTAVILRADAVLHAEMRMRSSIRLSFVSLHPVWMMKTSSSRTDSVILTLISPLENFFAVQGTRGRLSLFYMNTVRGPLGCVMEILQLTARPLLGRARGGYSLLGDEHSGAFQENDEEMRSTNPQGF